MDEQPIQQAFGSPGGKSYLASKIVGMIPPHKTYEEPFAGGAAVYFKKSPSDKEALSDKDTEIAFAFRFLRDMTPEQFRRLKRYNWQGSKGLFERLQTIKPKDDIERFRKFYYLKKASFAYGNGAYNYTKDDKTIDVDHLWKVHERLKRTTIRGGDAVAMIQKYDSPSTFHYLDPPYPERAFVGAKDTYTTEDLARLINVLRNIKGKFALSLGTEHVKLLPSNWHIQRVKVARRIPTGGGEWNKTYQYEIIATNYNPDGRKPHKIAVQKSTIRHKLRSKQKRNHRHPMPSAIGISTARY